jgi:hypothetical protein
MVLSYYFLECIKNFMNILYISETVDIILTKFRIWSLR